MLCQLTKTEEMLCLFFTRKEAVISYFVPCLMTDMIMATEPAPPLASAGEKIKS